MNPIAVKLGKIALKLVASAAIERFLGPAKPIRYFLKGLIDNPNTNSISTWVLDQTYNMLHFSKHTKDNSGNVYNLYNLKSMGPERWQAIGWCPACAMAGLLEGIANSKYSKAFSRKELERLYDLFGIGHIAHKNSTWHHVKEDLL